MIVTALILAAGVAASPAPTSETPNLYRQPARCGPLHDQIVQRQQAALRGKARGLQYAVLRKVDGCPLSTPVGYHPDYLAPGKADAPPDRPISDTERR